MCMHKMSPPVFDKLEINTSVTEPRAQVCDERTKTKFLAAASDRFSPKAELSLFL